MPTPIQPPDRPRRPSSPSAGWLTGRGRSRTWWRRTDLRGVWLGLAVTLIAHLLLWWSAPHLDLLMPAGNNAASDRFFAIEMNPETFPAPERTPVPVETPLPQKFVEVNPDAPANAPDKTDNFGAQDQQLAQPEPGPQDSAAAAAPRSEGDDTHAGAAIVSGQLAPRTLPPAPAVPPSPEQPAAPQDVGEAARLRQIPRPGIDAVQGDNPDGVATTAGDQPGTASAAVDGATDGRPDGYALLRGLVKVDRNRPQARPSLPAVPNTARPAPLLKNPIGTRNIGAVGYDAKWSDYGAYLQKLVETVQAQWERQIIRSSIYPTPGTVIVVTFVLNKRGEVDRIVKVGGSEDRTAGYLCMSAITERAPYGEWTEDMVGVLGESQEITFTFHYQ